MYVGIGCERKPEKANAHNDCTKLPSDEPYFWGWVTLVFDSLLPHLSTGGSASHRVIHEYNNIPVEEGLEGKTYEEPNTHANKRQARVLNIEAMAFLKDNWKGLES